MFVSGATRSAEIISTCWAFEPIRGRVLHPDDDVKRGGHPVAVISYSCWQGRFGGDPDIAGKKVKIGGLDYTIVGVTPQAFIGTELVYTPEIFVPVAMARTD